MSGIYNQVQRSYRAIYISALLTLNIDATLHGISEDLFERFLRQYIILCKYCFKNSKLISLIFAMLGIIGRNNLIYADVRLQNDNLDY